VEIWMSGDSGRVHNDNNPSALLHEKRVYVSRDY
jgi:hypothetical protein